MKQIVRFTESDIHRIVKRIINEIGYRGATLTVGANMKANAELANGRMYNKSNSRNNMQKVDDSAKLMYKAISHSVIDMWVYLHYFSENLKMKVISQVL